MGHKRPVRIHFSLTNKGVHLKRLFALLLPLLIGVLVLFSFTPPAQAATSLPTSQTCNPCESLVSWGGGTTGGGQTTFYIPALSLSGSDYLLRAFSMVPSGNADKLIMGYEANYDYGGICGGVLSQAVFIGEYSGAGALNYGKCYGIAYSGTFQFYANPSGPADEAFGIACQSGVCQKSGIITNVQSNLASSYTGVNEKVKTTVNGTFQGASYFTYNEYYHNGWVYQSNGGSLTHITTPAVQMYWNPSPNGATNHGGSLEMCEKDSGSTC